MILTKKMVWVQGGCFQIVTENLMRYLVMVGMMNNEIELKWLLSATLDEQTHLINEYRRLLYRRKIHFLKKQNKKR